MSEIPLTGHEFDVLAGRGLGVRRLVGSVQYRTWVNLFKNQFDFGPKKERKQIAARIVAMIQVSGGRFMVFDDTKGKWEESSDRKAMHKTLQALRVHIGEPSTSFTDVEVLPYRERFYRLWDSEMVRKRAEEILDPLNQSTKLSLHPKSRKFVPTSEHFVMPYPSDNEDHDAEDGPSVGNVQFRTWVNLFKDQYDFGPENERKQIAARIVAMVQVSGGHFMVSDDATGTLKESSDKKAMGKTLRALREHDERTNLSLKDKVVRRYRKRFYRLWDSKPVRKRAQELLNPSNETLSVHPNSRRFVPTSEDFVIPSPWVDDDGNEVDDADDAMRCSREQLPRLKSNKVNRSNAKPRSQIEYIHTTLSGLPIQATTLDMEDLHSESDSCDFWDLTPKIRRTSIIMSNKQHRAPLYNFDLDLPDTDDEEMVPLYGALHDLDELVALGIVNTMPIKSKTVTRVPHQRSEDNHNETHDASSGNMQLRTRQPKRSANAEIGLHERATSKKIVHERTNYPKLFGPGEPFLFGGAPPRRPNCKPPVSSSSQSTST